MRRSALVQRHLLMIVTSICLLMLPLPAGAHLVTTGMGPVYDGIGHLLLTPEDLIPALAVALYAGLRGAATSRSVLFVFPIAWLAGGGAGLHTSISLNFPLSSISFMLLGLLIATDFRLPPRSFTLLAVCIGLVHGFFNGIALQRGPEMFGLLGITGMLFIVVALAAAFVISLSSAWTRIVVRVLGSWTVAVGILMIGWFLRGKLSV
jgi:hydrogenase/urease accessory protein HupE